ncbi:MAG: FAD-dependent monooxygenase [Treponema sp.]|nr:FAD-dependent monooxygenase [Treponema sp.]
MSLEFTLTLKPEQENDSALIKKLLRREINARILKTDSAHGRNASGAVEKNSLNDDFNFRCVKKSVDARHGQLKLVMRFKVWGKDEDENADTKIPTWKKADSGKSVIIVGAGPAGLFGALTLLENGIKPVIIERGSETSKRKRDIAAISTKDFVNSDSNYCFGDNWRFLFLVVPLQ